MCMRPSTCSFVDDEIFKIVGVYCVKVQDEVAFDSLVLNASIRNDNGLCVAAAHWTKSCPLSLVLLFLSLRGEGLS